MRIIRHYACVWKSPLPHFPHSYVCVCVGMHVIVLTISIHKSVCGMQIYCILCRQAAAFSFRRCRCCCRCCCCCCCSASVWSVPALLWFSLSFLRFSLFVSFCFGLVWFSFCLQLKRVFDWDLHLPLACVCVCVGGKLENVCRYWDLGAKVSPLSKRILCGCFVGIAGCEWVPACH